MVSLLISTWIPVRVGSESSFPAAIATWFTAVAKTSLEITPVVSGMVGKFGYSFIGRVGRVNFDVAAVTRTRLLSNVNVTGLFGSDRAISASNRPGTKTFPLSLISALNVDFADVSKSDAESVTSWFTSITIPSNAVIIGRVDKLRDTQLTLSTNALASTVNFIM